MATKLDQLRQKVGSNPAATASGGRPSWINADAKNFGKLDSAANDAYVEIFGREIDPSGLAEFRAAVADKGQFNSWKKQLVTMEGSRVDPADYGIKKVSPPEDDPFYQAWRAANPGKPFYETDARYLKWEKDATKGDVRAFQAKMAGEITVQSSFDSATGKVANAFIVSPAAIDRMGGQFTYAGVRPGDVYYVPEGTTFAHSDTGILNPDGPSNGYISVFATGNPQKALLERIPIGDSNLGEMTKDITEGLPGGSWVTGGVIGGVPGLVLGQQAGSALIHHDLRGEQNQFVSDYTGWDNQQVEQARGVANAVAAIATGYYAFESVASSQATLAALAHPAPAYLQSASMVTTMAGAAASSAQSIATAADQVIAYNLSDSGNMKNALISSGVSAASAGLGPALGVGAGSGFIGATERAGFAAGLDFAATAARTDGDWGAAGESAGWAAAGSYTGSALQSVASSIDMLDNIVGSTLSSVAAQQAVIEGRSSIDKDFAETRAGVTSAGRMSEIGLGLLQGAASYRKPSTSAKGLLGYSGIKAKFKPRNTLDSVPIGDVQPQPIRN